MLNNVFKTWGASHKLWREVQKPRSDAGNLEQRVQTLIAKKRADVNYAADPKKDYSPTEWTILGLACANGHVDVVRMLLKAGANVQRAKSSNKHSYATPLHVAASKGHLRVVKVLVEHGAEINPTKESTPLCVASDRGHAYVVEWLLEHGAHVHPRRERGNRRSYNPLYAACRYGHHKVVKLLLAHGAQLHHEDQHGESIYLALKDHGGIRCDVEQEEQRREATNESFLRGYADDSEATQEFLQEVGKWRDIDEGHLRQLLQNKEVNADCRATNGWTPLGWACSRGNLRVVKLLVEHGAQANGAQGDPLRPLFLACRHGDLRIVQFLLDNQAQVDCVGIYHKEPLKEVPATPLMWACGEGKTELVRLLLDHGANVEWATYTYGKTPLFAACDGGHVEIVRMLLGEGAETSIFHPAKYINDMNELVEPEYTERATSSNKKIQALLAAANEKN